ncbi:hypothetical protein SAMN05444161_1321 [Rhizobiales bacterium GAS191]|nr:hypothetical protein SAMN05444161_1321 [Rhizobiales bacterium GAS191]
MTMSKTVVQSIDFDDIERQLREVARTVGLDRPRSGSAGRSRPDAARLRRPLSGLGARSRVGLAVALPLLVVAAGIGVVTAISTGPASQDVSVNGADGASVKAPPTLVAGGSQAASASAPGNSGPSDKPDGTVVAPSGRPDAVVANPTPGQAATPSPQPAASSPATMLTTAANVPLPDLPRASAQNSIFGTPHRVLTLSVKPDGTIGPGRKANLDAGGSGPTKATSSDGGTSAAAKAEADPSQAAAQSAIFGKQRRVASLSVRPDGTILPNAGLSAAPKTKPASTEAAASLSAPGAPGTVAPAAKKHDDKGRSKSSRGASAERRQISKTAMSILPPPAAGNAQPRIDASPPPGGPVTRVANGFRKVLEMVHIVGPATGDAQ